MKQMITISQIITVSIIAFILLQYFYHSYIKVSLVQNYRSKTVSHATEKGWYIFVMLLIALLFKIAIASDFMGHQGDISCFKTWGYKLWEHGFASMYRKGDFTDYPPGYLYVLGALAGFCKTFGIDSATTLATVIFKLPACICDIITGYLLYKMARRKFGESISVLCSAVYVFNPAVIINSSIWGQVDSVYTLFLVIMCYLIVNKKLPFAYLTFAIGILIKPQMLIFSPVLFWAVIEQVFLDGFDKKNFWKNLLSGLGAIGAMLLLMLPFGLEKVLNQYMNTITSYPKATVNAYNIWTMFGLNWQEQTGTFLKVQYNHWGMLFIVFIVLSAVYLCYRCRKDDSKYFMIAGFIISGVFMFSVRMHERYMFPALVLILMAFLMKPVKELFYAFIGLTIIHFLNVSHVLYYYKANSFSPKAMIPMIIAALSLGVVIYLFYTAYKWYYCDTRKQEKYREEYMEQLVKDKNTEKKEFGGIRLSEKKVKITKWDFLVLGIIVLIYSAVALHDLGDKTIPHTEYLSKESNTTIVLDMGEGKALSEVSYYLGNYEARKMTLESAPDVNGPWNQVSSFEMTSVFSWGTAQASTQERYIRLTCSNDSLSLMELVLLDAEGKKIEPLNSSDYPELFDEQDLYAERSYMNGTYFDEIYHARTAYEYIKGRYSYENTHPPLGKAIMSIGMLIFGVCPFGWRIMGVLFGIAMLPFIYLFARRFFKEIWIAGIVTTLFAFDFMHFTQTRIATIDVFVTFFIIAMYYFMYRYVTMSFYDQKLWKTWIPLGLSGICMGLGAASKWTGIYAGAGLGVIFFMNLYRRFREYQWAKDNIKGSTQGIEHKDVVDKFPKYTLKTIVFCVVFFIVIPVIIYVLSYLPFSDGTGTGLIAQVLRNQKTMFSYHSNLVSTHPYSSTWYQWPVIYRPIYYYQRTISTTVSEAISAFGNPLVWWAGIPAFIYMLYLVVKKKDNKALFLVIAYLAQYLPWVAVTRTTYIYHYFTSIPFVTMMIGYSMFKLAEQKKGWKYAAVVYTAAAVGLFAAFYPVLSGHPIEKQFVYDWLKWFDSWVLIS